MSAPLKVEVYWVTSDCEEPLRIYFSVIAALDSNAAYIDSFDADGEVVKRMKRVGEGNYTTKF